MKVIEARNPYSANPTEWKEMGRFETYGSFRSDYGRYLEEAREHFGYYNVRAWLISSMIPAGKILIAGEGAVPPRDWA